MRIHHIGYLVKKIEAAKIEFEKLGFALSGSVVLDKARAAKICFLEGNGCRVELISPVDESSPVYGLMAKRKNSPYHICYETENLENDIASLCDNGFMVFQAPEPAPAIGCRQVAFLTNPEIGMVELLGTMVEVKT
jgi:methylmalonyl-CoA/ethylmalonyl-CoA epimerase